ncbi:hypothetical protein Patl1_37009 [Pistacia atlantica]|nr:hypothetical protein Patl1_37009 [Pistacia atlantica]
MMGCSLFTKYFAFLILFLLFYYSFAQYNVQELHALFALKAMFNDPFLNQTWTGIHCFNNYPPQWYGIQCVNGNVTGIILQGMSLKGIVNSDAFMKVPELTILSFNNNSISGNVMDFSSNHKLKDIDLSGNNLSGNISTSLLSLDSLESLQLQDNKLTGAIPAFNQSSLKVFNVSNNNLSGEIPKTPTLQSFNSTSFSKNLELCGSPSFNPCSFSQNDTGTPGDDKDSHKSDFPKTMLILIVVAGLIGVISFTIFYFYNKGRNRKRVVKKEEDDEVEEYEAEEEEAEVQRNAETGKSKVIVGGDQEKRGNLIFMVDEAGFELNDLLKASAEGLGKGIFGNSYKAKLEGRTAVVVKRLRDLKPMSNEDFTKQLHIIAGHKHPNLLPLLAYYYSKEEKLLVFKYAENGNLFNLIHGGTSSQDRIPFKWSSRLSVARGVARALEYLHLHTRSQSIVPHGNLKPSNILLDEEERVLVSDYGFSSLLAHPIAVQRMVSYKSPEYQSSKKISRKSDVWSYGCLLLELLTGRISVHSAPPGIKGVDLTRWVIRAVREEWTAEIFDPEISVRRGAGHGMLKLLQIAIRCCDKSPEKRPEMTEVVREVENIRFVESEDEEDLSVDQSFTGESISTNASK